MRLPLKRVIDFCRDGTNQHLATWLQTMCVIVGVVIALQQLGSFSESEKLRRNARYLEIGKQFSSDISRKMGILYEFYQDRKRLSDDDLSEKYTLDQVLKLMNDIQIYIQNVGYCGKLDVCPSAHVDSFVCSLAKNMHSLLAEQIELPPRWKMKFSYPAFYERMINDHCDLIDRVLYWVNA